MESKPILEVTLLSIYSEKERNACVGSCKQARKVLREKPQVTMEDLSERSGFGSVNSMKRSIHASTGLSLQDFKKQ